MFQRPERGGGPGHWPNKDEDHPCLRDTAWAIAGCCAQSFWQWGCGPSEWSSPGETVINTMSPPNFLNQNACGWGLGVSISLTSTQMSLPAAHQFWESLLAELEELPFQMTSGAPLPWQRAWQPFRSNLLYCHHWMGNTLLLRGVPGVTIEIIKERSSHPVGRVNQHHRLVCRENTELSAFRRPEQYRRRAFCRRRLYIRWSVWVYFFLNTNSEY